MKLHVYVKRVDLYKAHGFCLGTVIANPGDDSTAWVLGYLDGVVAKDVEDGDPENDEIDFYFTAEGYLAALMTVFDTCAIAHGVLQAA